MALYRGPRDRHLLLHRNKSILKTCTAQDLATYRTSGHEPEANEFAAELLMPEPLFAPMCDVKRPSMTEVRELAERFATSWTSTAIRFVECSAEPCALVFTEKKRVKWWMRNASFAFTLERGVDLSPDTYAHDLAMGKSVDDRMQRTDGSAWSDSHGADDIELYEHPIALSAHDAVLTLLWHPSTRS